MAAPQPQSWYPARSPGTGSPAPHTMSLRSSRTREERKKGASSQGGGLSDEPWCSPRACVPVGAQGTWVRKRTLRTKSELVVSPGACTGSLSGTRWKMSTVHPPDCNANLHPILPVLYWGELLVSSLLQQKLKWLLSSEPYSFNVHLTVLISVSLKRLVKSTKSLLTEPASWQGGYPPEKGGLFCKDS